MPAFSGCAGPFAGCPVGAYCYTIDCTNAFKSTLSMSAILTIWEYVDWERSDDLLIFSWIASSDFSPLCLWLIFMKSS